MSKLLDTSGANTKLNKNNKNTTGIFDYLNQATGKIVQGIRVAGLSLFPDDKLCPFSEVAGCQAPCLASAGRGKMSNVKSGRERKAQWLKDDPEDFLANLRRELYNFKTLCHREGVLPIVRLNVLSDVCWELKRYGEIPQEFEDIFFYDYTKLSARLGRTPSNYHLMFSWSGTSKYQVFVDRALKTDTPIAVVFDTDKHSTFPETFLDRPVYDGDQSDILNLTRRNGIIGLKAKGDARDLDHPFVVRIHNNLTELPKVA